MGAKVLKNILLGSIIVGQLTLGLWQKHERLWGAQRSTTYVEKTVKREKHLEILAVSVFFTGAAPMAAISICRDGMAARLTASAVAAVVVAATPVRTLAVAAVAAWLATAVSVGSVRPSRWLSAAAALRQM